MATNIGNRISNSGTDLLSITLGMPNTSKNMYKTVSYCDTYTGMEGVPLGTVMAEATYSRTQQDIVTGTHRFVTNDGSYQHINTWTWNENSNTTGDDSGRVVGTFSLPPTSSSNIPVDGGTISFQPTGLTISQSPNITSYRYLDEPITVTIGEHKSTYDYGGTVSFKTSDADPKGIGQSCYNRANAYYSLHIRSNSSWVTPFVQDVDITSNTPTPIAFNVAKQTLASKSGEGLKSNCAQSLTIPKEGGERTILLNNNGTSGFTIPSVENREFHLAYEVTAKNSSVIPSGITGNTTTITQNGKTGILSYLSSITSGTEYASLTNANTGTPIITFDKQTYSIGVISGEIGIENNDITVEEYSDLQNKTAPTASFTISGWAIKDPVEATNRTATVTSNISWANVDTINTNPTTTTLEFVQQGISYSPVSGTMSLILSGDNMDKYPTITNATSDTLSNKEYLIKETIKSPTVSKTFNVQFPWIRPANIGGSANGSITLPDNISDSSTYFTSKTWEPSISSNITFVNAHVEAQPNMSWKVQVVGFDKAKEDIDNQTTASNKVLTLTQKGNEYGESATTSVNVKATSDSSWLTPTSSLTLNENTSSGNINFNVTNNNANLASWSINQFQRNSNTINFGIYSNSKNTNSRKATITWGLTNSESGTVTTNHNTSTYTQAASSITGTILLDISGNAITGNNLQYTFNSYPISQTLSYTVPSSRIVQAQNHWDPSNISISIASSIDYSDSFYTADIGSFGKLVEATQTSYTIDFSCTTLHVGSRTVVSGASAVDDWGFSYLSPTNKTIISGTYYTTNIPVSYTCRYRTWGGSTHITSVDDISENSWGSWQNASKTSFTVDVGTNYGTTYSGTLSQNSGSTLEGGWTYTSGGRRSSSDYYFAIQLNVVDDNASSNAKTVGDYFWQDGQPASSNNDTISFSLSSTSNCSVSGNYSTAQAGSSIPSSVSITPNYSSGTKSWYKNGNYYGTSEPTRVYSTNWTGSICSNTNNNGSSTIAIWESLSDYDRTCGVTGGTSSYTSTTTSPSFTKYYTYSWSATMYPSGYSSLSKTQSGTGTSSTSTISATSSSTEYSRYVSWDGGSTWGSTTTKKLSDNNYSLRWSWKYATSSSGSALYSGSGSCSVSKSSSASMSISGSVTLNCSGDSIYQGDSGTASCSIQSDTTSGTETSAGKTRTITTSTKIYYSLNNSSWTEGSSYTLNTSTSTSTGTTTIYWKCIVTASSGYSSTTKTYTGSSSITVKSLYSYSTEYDYDTEYQNANYSSSSSYSGSAPTVTVTGGGTILSWAANVTISASASGTNVTKIETTTWDKQRRTGSRYRSVTTNNKTGTTTYGSWSSWSYGSWSTYSSDSSKSTSTVTGSITMQYKVDSGSWTNGYSTTVNPPAGSNASSTGSSTVVSFRAQLYYGSQLIATGTGSGSASRYGVSYYNR